MVTSCDIHNASDCGWAKKSTIQCQFHQLHWSRPPMLWISSKYGSCAGYEIRKILRKILLHRILFTAFALKCGCPYITKDTKGTTLQQVFLGCTLDLMVWQPLNGHSFAQGVTTGITGMYHFLGLRVASDQKFQAVTVTVPFGLWQTSSVDRRHGMIRKQGFPGVGSRFHHIFWK